MTGPHTEKTTVLALYAAFGVSMILCLIPSVVMGVVSLLFIIGVLIAAYAIRRRAAAESLTENHATFIIRTIWIASLISVVTLAAGSAVMLEGIDYSPFSPCAETLAGKGTAALESAGFREIYAAAEPCMHGFITTNLRLLTLTSAIVAVPVILYILIRYLRGFSRALKGYRIAKPEGWL